MKANKYLIAFILLAAAILAAPSLGIAQQIKTEAPDADTVTVYLDNDVMREAKRYSLEKDNTFQLKVYNLQPASTIFVDIDFAGFLGLGSKEEEKRADADGEFRMLFDTPNRKAKATVAVRYTDAKGVDHEKTFDLKVQ